MGDFNNFIDYWNNWHQNWWENNNDNILDWPIPNGNGNQQYPIFDYYPEPYYYRFNGDDNRIDAIFLNINPGSGADIQYRHNKNSELINQYIHYNRDYQQTLPTLLQNQDTNNFLRRREKFTNNLLNTENSKVLSVDLVPWHTSNQSNIKKYILDNFQLAIKHVIKPLIRIACNGNGNHHLARKIIIRGTSFRDIINKVGQEIFPQHRLRQIQNSVKYYCLFDENNVLHHLSSFLTVLETFNCKFYMGILA